MLYLCCSKWFCFLILLLVQPNHSYMNHILMILLMNPTWHAKKIVPESDCFKLGLGNAVQAFKQITSISGK